MFSETFHSPNSVTLVEVVSPHHEEISITSFGLADPQIGTILLCCNIIFSENNEFKLIVELFSETVVVPHETKKRIMI